MIRMPKLNYTQNSWTGGAVRHDLVGLELVQSTLQYSTSAEEIENANILNPVGIARRRGFQYFATTTAQKDKNTLLIRFNTRDGCYILVFSGAYVDGKDAGGNDIIVQGKIEIFDCSGKLVDTITDYIQIKRSSGKIIIDQEGTNDESITTDTETGVFPYQDSDIPNVKHAFTKRGMYMVDGNHMPSKLIYDEKSKKFTFSEMRINSNEKTSVTNPATNYWDNQPYRKPPTERRIFFDNDFDRTKPVASNPTNPVDSRNGSYHLGFPKVISVFDNRLIFANTELYPNGIWCSTRDAYDSEADYTNFTLGINGDDAIEQYLAIGNGRVLYLTHGRTLQIFTTEGIYTTSKNFVSPLVGDFTLNKQTQFHLNSDILPIYVNGRTIYMKDRILEYLTMTFNNTTSAALYESHDVAQYSNAILNAKKIAYRQSQDSDNSDQLFVLTDEKLIAINMNKIHTDAGVITSAGFVDWNTNGDAKTNKNPDKIINIETFDHDLYLLVQREDKIFIEKFNLNNDLDCSVSGTDLASIDGKLDHLEGKDVNIIYDNFIMKDKVIGGKLTSFPNKVTNPIKEIEVGLPYYFRLKSLPVRRIPFDLLEENIKLLEFRLLFSESLNAVILLDDRGQINLLERQLAVNFPDKMVLIKKQFEKSQFSTVEDYYHIGQDQPMKMKLIMVKIEINKS